MEELYLNYIEKKQQYLFLKNQLNQRGGNGDDPCVDHKCRKCSNLFTTVEDLNTHITKEHGEDKDYQELFVNVNKYTPDIEENLKEWGFMFDLEKLETDKSAAVKTYDDAFNKLETDKNKYREEKKTKKTKKDIDSLVIDKFNKQDKALKGPCHDKFKAINRLKQAEDNWSEIQTYIFDSPKEQEHRLFGKGKTDSFFKFKDPNNPSIDYEKCLQKLLHPSLTNFVNTSVTLPLLGDYSPIHHLNESWFYANKYFRENRIDSLIITKFCAKLKGYTTTTTMYEFIKTLTPEERKILLLLYREVFNSITTEGKSSFEETSKYPTTCVIRDTFESKPDEYEISLSNLKNKLNDSCTEILNDEHRLRLLWLLYNDDSKLQVQGEIELMMLNYKIMCDNLLERLSKVHDVHSSTFKAYETTSVDDKGSHETEIKTYTKTDATQIKQYLHDYRYPAYHWNMKQLLEGEQDIIYPIIEKKDGGGGTLSYERYLLKNKYSSAEVDVGIIYGLGELETYKVDQVDLHDTANPIDGGRYTQLPICKDDGSYTSPTTFLFTFTDDIEPVKDYRIYNSVEIVHSVKELIMDQNPSSEELTTILKSIQEKGPQKEEFIKYLDYHFTDIPGGDRSTPGDWTIGYPVAPNWDHSYIKQKIVSEYENYTGKVHAIEHYVKDAWKIISTYIFRTNDGTTTNNHAQVTGNVLGSFDYEDKDYINNIIDRMFGKGEVDSFFRIKESVAAQMVDGSKRKDKKREMYGLLLKLLIDENLTKFVEEEGGDFDETWFNANKLLTGISLGIKEEHLTSLHSKLSKYAPVTYPFEDTDEKDREEKDRFKFGGTLSDPIEMLMWREIRSFPKEERIILKLLYSKITDSKCTPTSIGLNYVGDNLDRWWGICSGAPYIGSKDGGIEIKFLSFSSKWKSIHDNKAWVKHLARVKKKEKEAEEEAENEEKKAVQDAHDEAMKQIVNSAQWKSSRFESLGKQGKYKLY